MKPSGKISRRAYTLVELLVVMAIIGILVAITMGIYGTVKRKGIESRLKAELAVIELALENYKADPDHNQYPASDPWVYKYPPTNWKPLGAGAAKPLGNELYRDLVAIPMARQNSAGQPNPKKPYLPNLKESQYDEDEVSLLAPVPDVRGGPGSSALAKWYYNSNDPRYNKNSYDLWVEYGDLGKDTDSDLDDTVRIISNWNK